ncbi:MAG: cytochrome c maturation protein CcmE [Eggerthellaceae bacterium]|nr:cytochrome c maturation protein CcmE [Eggerthellaceae bacterium]
MIQKNKSRLIVVTGIIIAVVIVVFAIVAGGTSAKTISVAQAASGQFDGQRVEVSGNVVSNSYYLEGNTFKFSIYDASVTTGESVLVSYDGSVAATFGNDVIAICTGRMSEDGVLMCTNLVTKCPSKYESGLDALDVSQLLNNSERLTGKMLKVTGVLKSGSLAPAGSDVRLSIVSSDGISVLQVNFNGALSDEVIDGCALVILGSLSDNGVFVGTEVSLKG